MKRNYKISFVYYGYSSLRMHTRFIENLASICRSVNVFDLNRVPFNTNDFSRLIAYKNYFRVIKIIKVKFLKMYRYLKYISNLISFIYTSDSDLFFINSFKGAFLIPIIFRKRLFVLHMTTTSVSTNILKRIWQDFSHYKLNTFFYKHILIESQNIQDQYRIPNKKTYLTDWGYSAIEFKERKFDKLNLIYLGTLESRKLYKTIYGLQKFYQEYKNKISIQYDIIGGKHKKDIEKIQNAIIETKLDKIINYIGPVPDMQLFNFFNNANIGISFVPITKYYDQQPVSKTYEYLLSGMPVIATKTQKNKEIINNTNGVLIEDDDISFYMGLVKIYENLHYYNSTEIKYSAIKYTWDSVINNYIVYFDKLLCT